MKPILAIETATFACSAALIHSNSVYSRFEIAPKAHAQLIFPMIESLLEEAELPLKAIGAIAVGRGPGSFTGVRIAMSVAQGLGFGLNLPVYPISTLAALVLQAREHIGDGDEKLIVPALDARMQEVYTAVCAVNTDIKDPLKEHVCPPSALRSMIESQFPNPLKILAIGSGWEAYSKELIEDNHSLSIRLLPHCHPNAIHIGLIAKACMESGEQGVAPEDALPVYLRDNVAEKKK